VNIQWSRPEDRWYLGVHCRKCHSPILFAVDRSDGVRTEQTPQTATLVLTCTAEKCKHKADYTGAAIQRLQKSTADGEKTSGSVGGGKNGKRKV